MTAPELSEREWRIVAEFEAAPTPPEVLREQVARLLFCEFVNGDGSHWTHPGDWAQEQRDECYRVADAALAVFRDQQDPARQFAEWVVSLDDDDPESPGRQARRTLTLALMVDRARAAIGGDGR